MPVKAPFSGNGYDEGDREGKNPLLSACQAVVHASLL